MPWDEHRVRLELGEGMRVVWDEETKSNQMRATHTIEIFKPNEAGKFLKKKPACILTGESRVEVLRSLADWIDQNDDPGLDKVIAQFQEQVAARG